MKKLFIFVSLVMLVLVVMMSACSAAIPDVITADNYHGGADLRPENHYSNDDYSCSDLPLATTSRPTTTSRPSTTQPPVVITQVPAPTITIPAGSAQQNTLGLSTGGAKDINNFRENIRNNYLPLPTDITYEGLFYDYYFDTGTPAGHQ